MVLIALPWFASELAAAFITLVITLLVVRRRPLRPYDAAREYDSLETRIRTKANHPYTYPLRMWLTKGE